MLYILFFFLFRYEFHLVIFFVLRDGCIPLAIRFKKRRRFVSYYHQLLETLNDLVHRCYSFKETLWRVSDPSLFWWGRGEGGGGIEGSWLCLFPPNKIPCICNQCSVISAYCMITYDYVSHCYSWILNVTFVGKGLIKCIMLHYFVKIQNVRTSFFEQKKNQLDFPHFSKASCATVIQWLQIIRSQS